MLIKTKKYEPFSTVTFYVKQKDTLPISQALAHTWPATVYSLKHEFSMNYNIQVELSQDIDLADDQCSMNNGYAHSSVRLKNTSQSYPYSSHNCF